MKVLHVSLFVVLSLIATGARAEPHFYVGLTGVQSASASGGSIRFVDVMVGSNETAASAAPWTLWVTLAVKSDGKIVCRSSVETLSKVRPAIHPLQFRVFYPNPPRGSTRLKPRIRIADVKYELFASLEVRGASGLIQKTKNTIVWDFPGGGTPSCVQN